MTNEAQARLTWVTAKDGRLVPFEADRISRDLFAAGERLGQPDAVLVRELTDSVVHFLALESEGAVPTTAQVAELVVKVVRELGHPGLARAFAALTVEPAPGALAATEVDESARAPDPDLEKTERVLQRSLSAAELTAWLSRASLERYSLQRVYSPDLAALHREGLLTIGNLDAPLQLAGLVPKPPRPGWRPGQLLATVLEARRLAGEIVVLDSPEYARAFGSSPEPTARALAHELHLGLEATALRAVVNLNCAQPPLGAGAVAEGPLFAEKDSLPDTRRASLDLLGELAQIPPGDAGEAVRIDWHLGERDFQPQAVARLEAALALALGGSALTFVFDRPRRPVQLAEGLDRQQPALLLTIGLNLPRLAAQPGLTGRPEQFLDKLDSLVRAAFSVAGQKRDFLRSRCPELVRTFLLDRARVVLAPVGLEALVRQRFGQPLAAAGAGMEFARMVLQRLREALQQTSRYRRLDARLEYATRPDPPPPGAPTIPGRQLLFSEGQLRSTSDGGTTWLAAASPAEALELLRYARQRTEVGRLRFLCKPLPRPAAAKLWEAD